MFELRRLRLLSEVAHRGTLAAVAEALSYSPSTVSQQLAVLEREAGVALLEPDGRRVRLTAAGRLLAEHAGRMLAADEQIGNQLRADTAMVVDVRIATIHTAVHPVVSTAIAGLLTSHPHLHLTVTALPPEQALRELAARTYDLVIAEQYPGITRPFDPDVVRHPIGADPIELAVPVSDPSESLADVASRAWVVEPQGTAARAWALQQCRAAGFEPMVRFEVADPQIHRQLIAAGHAVGLLPGLVRDFGAAPAVRRIPLPGEPRRELMALTRRASSDSQALAMVRAALVAAYQDQDGPLPWPQGTR